MRHSRITALHEQGLDPKHITSFVGHKDPKSALHYINPQKLKPETLAATLARLDNEDGVGKGMMGKDKKDKDAKKQRSSGEKQWSKKKKDIKSDQVVPAQR